MIRLKCIVCGRIVFLTLVDKKTKEDVDCNSDVTIMDICNKCQIEQQSQIKKITN